MPAEAIRINRRVLLQCSIGAPGLKQPFAQPQQNGALSRDAVIGTSCSEGRHRHLHASFLLKARIRAKAESPTKHGESAVSRNILLLSCKVYRYYSAITSQGFARESCYRDRLE